MSTALTFDSAKPILRKSAIVLAIAVAYAITAWTGLRLDPVAGFASYVWPPTGIAIAATLLMGEVAGASVFVGAFVANAIAGAPVLAAAAVAAGNTIEALLAAYVLRRLGFRVSFERLYDAYVFTLVAVAAPIVAATIGVSSLVVAGTVVNAQAMPAWQAWWLGDAIGALLLAPLLLVWTTPDTRTSRAMQTELAVIAIVLVLVAAVVFFQHSALAAPFLQAYLVFPVVLWATVRHEQRGATVAVFLTAAVAVAGTARFTGPFAHEALGRSLFALQSFMGIVAATFLMLSTAIAERTRARRTLQDLVAHQKIAVTAAQHAEQSAYAAAHRMGQLQAVTAELAAIVKPDEINETLLRQGLRALNASHAVLCTVTDDGQELEIVAQVGLPEDVVQSFRRYRIDAPLPLSVAVRTSAALYLENRAEVVRRFPNLREANSRAKTDAWIALPLTLRGETIGGIAFGFELARGFNESDRSFATALAHQAALAIDRTRVYTAEQRARLEAEAANRAKSQFLATMSHELRTPLNAIVGYAELLEMGIHGSLQPGQGEVVDRIRRSERRLRALIEDVLGFARIESGHLDLTLGAVNVRSALAEVETLIEPQRHAKHVQLVQDVDDTLTVRADPKRVQQIILNLLANAVKFSPPDATVTLGAKRVGAMAELRVTDSGAGIPADKLDAIFEPFVQLGRTLSTPQEGWGLGLAISRELARAMGGDVRVESEVGRGSTFTLTLPAQG